MVYVTNFGLNKQLRMQQWSMSRIYHGPSQLLSDWNNGLCQKAHHCQKHNHGMSANYGGYNWYTYLYS